MASQGGNYYNPDEWYVGNNLNRIIRDLRAYHEETAPLTVHRNNPASDLSIQVREIEDKKY